MLTLMSDRFAPITSMIGFLRCPFDEAVDGLRAWRQHLHRRVSVSSLLDGLPTLLRALEPLTGRVRPRELLVATAGDWVAYFDCGVRGADPVSAIGYLSRALGCQGLAVTSVPHTAGTGLEVPGRYGAVQFELFGPLATDFLNYVRTVSVAYDGSGWRFDAAGTVQDFEQVDRYAARRVRDRFTSQMLAEYCAALGVRALEENFYNHRGALVESAVSISSDAKVLSLEEAQKWLGIVPGAAEKVSDG